MRIAPLILASHLHFPFSVSGFTQNTPEAQMTCYQASSSSSSCFCAFSLTALSVYSCPVFFSFFFSLTLHLSPPPPPFYFFPSPSNAQNTIATNHHDPPTALPTSQRSRCQSCYSLQRSHYFIAFFISSIVSSAEWPSFPPPISAPITNQKKCKLTPRTPP
jgi:hypothetical protein